MKKKRRANGTSIEEYKKVQEYMRKNPRATVRAALRAVGVTESSYFRGRRQLAAAGEPTTHVAIQPMAADAGKLMVLIGTIEQIRGVIA